MRTSGTKNFVRRDNRTGTVNEYAAKFELGKLTLLYNLTTDREIPASTRTFRKVANGHRDFVVVTAAK